MSRSLAGLFWSKSGRSRGGASGIGAAIQVASLDNCTIEDLVARKMSSPESRVAELGAKGECKR